MLLLTLFQWVIRTREDLASLDDKAKRLSDRQDQQLVSSLMPENDVRNNAIVPQMLIPCT